MDAIQHFTEIINHWSTGNSGRKIPISFPRVCWAGDDKDKFSPYKRWLDKCREKEITCLNIFEIAINAVPTPDIILASNVTCKSCGNVDNHVMPRYASKSHYECPACHEIFHTKKTDCCIFCSMGDVKCPPTQFLEKQRVFFSKKEM